MRGEERIIHGVKHELKYLDSMQDLIEYANAYQDCPNHGSFSTLHQSSFLGESFRNVDELLTLANGRWEKGMDILQGMMDELRDAALPQPKSRKRRLRWDEMQGDEVDRDRLGVGLPFWRRSRREMTNSITSLTLVTDITTMCAIDADKVIWRGAASVALTTLLEQAGYRVELWAANYCRPAFTDRTGGLVAVKLKGAGEPLNQSSLVNGISAWSYRTLMFNAMASSIKDRQPAFGLGPCQPLHSMLPFISPDPNKVVVADVWGKHAAINLIKETLSKLQPEESRR